MKGGETMLFILQKENDWDFDLEVSVLRDIVKRDRYLHEYLNEDNTFFDEGMLYPKKMNVKDAVVVGTIEFVSKYLKNVHEISHMAPIEIPKVLRKPEYLCREYSIITADDIPKKGNWFIKDASRLKQFSYCGDMSWFYYDGIFDEPGKMDTRLHLDKTHKFALSEVVNILSEYRVIVSDDKIEAIQHYDGYCTIMPTPDEIDKLKRMILNYQLDSDRPKTYAMDVAVIKKNDKRDLALIEVCPFASLGTYGYISDKLPYMYADGLRWYKEKNKEVEI